MVAPAGGGSPTGDGSPTGGGSPTVRANVSETLAPDRSVATTSMLHVPAPPAVPLSFQVDGSKVNHEGSGVPLASRALSVSESPTSTSENVLAGTVMLYGERAVAL